MIRELAPVDRRRAAMTACSFAVGISGTVRMFVVHGPTYFGVFCACWTTAWLAIAGDRVWLAHRARRRDSS